MTRWLALLIIAVSLTTCAPVPEQRPRVYTPEQEEQIRQMCEPHGCITVPTPMFESIIRALNRARGREA